ncbi:MAG: N-acetylmuramoyl-L-alanine amidase [Pseudomonadota bacterium]
MGPGPVSPGGWQLKRRWCPSPNCGSRRDGLIPTHVVLHYTAMDSAAAAIERLCDPAAQVSAHFVICRTGTVTQLVAEGLRAWHAGAGQWAGLVDINSRSIGIELDNDGASPFPAPQMRCLETLLRGLLTAWHIPPENVIGHSDMTPGRKIDPGPLFDWPRLEAQELARSRGTSPAARTVTPDAFMQAARRVGYTADADTETLLAAVRLRYRPGKTGPLDADDLTPLGN